MKLNPVSFYFIVFLFVSAVSVYSKEWKTFNKDNTGIPSNNILCVEIDDRGTKWFGTDSGLVQFDGLQWQVYSTDLYPNLADNYINDLIFESVDNQSLLWITTEDGVSLLDITNKDVPVFSKLYRTENSGLVNDSVKTLTIDPGHVKWFGTFSGASSFTQNAWQTFSAENFWLDHNRIVSLESGPDSMVYFGTEGGGVSRLKMDAVDGVTSASTLTTTWTGFDEPDSGKLTSNNVYAILVESNGHQWFGTDDGVALHTSYNTLRDWENYTIEDGLIDNFVQSICKEDENNMWFGTPQGASNFTGYSWTNYTSDDGLSHNNIRDIAIDKEGSVWFATEAGISVLTVTTAITNENIRTKNDNIKITSFPNPFNSQTSIVFKLKEVSSVKLDIFNCNGQHVKSLVNGSLASGKHAIKWDGYTEDGSIAPSGVYFVKLLTGEKINTHKILIIK